MTIPTADPALPTGPSPTAQAVRATVRLCNKIAAGCDKYISDMQSSPTDAGVILDILNKMSHAATNLTAYKGYAAFDDVAKATIPGYSGSLSADAQVTINAMNSTASWVVANVPKDANGWVLVYKWNTDGTVTGRLFQPATMAPLVAQLQTVRATIG